MKAMKMIIKVQNKSKSVAELSRRINNILQIIVMKIFQLLVNMNIQVSNGNNTKEIKKSIKFIIKI